MWPLMIPCEGIHRSCALKDACAYFYEEDSQFEDEELNMERNDIEQPEFHFLGTAQWSWAEIWNEVGADADLDAEQYYAI